MTDRCRKCVHRPHGQDPCRNMAYLDPCGCIDDTPDVIRVDLPWLNPPLSGNRVRGNPFVAAKKTEVALEQARWAIKAKVRHAYDEPVTVALHFRVKDYRRRDADNCFPTLKVCQDALVQEGVLLDDGWQHVRRASVEIHEPNGEPPAMWLEVERWKP